LGAFNWQIKHLSYLIGKSKDCLNLRGGVRFYGV
jgi:hypothetical protein